jgi:hypothetical protein
MVLAIINEYKRTEREPAKEAGSSNIQKRSRLDGELVGYETREHLGGEHEGEGEDWEDSRDGKEEKEEGEKIETESVRDEDEEVGGYLSVAASWGFCEPWLDSGLKEGFKKTMYVDLEGNITYVSGKENKMVNQQQAMFAKRVVGVEMKLHLLGPDQVLDCRGYLDTIAGYLRSPVAVPLEFQGTADLNRVLELGVLKSEENYVQFMMGKFSMDAPNMLCLGKSFVNPGRALPSGKGLASDGVLLYSEAMGNLGLTMAVLWSHVYRGIFDQFCQMITSHQSVLREMSAEVFTYYLEGMLGAAFVDLRLHRRSSLYPGHSLTGPVRVRNFFQHILIGLLDRLRNPMERLAMERKYETRMILPMSGALGRQGVRVSPGIQAKVERTLGGKAGGGIGAGKLAPDDSMCVYHVANQLGLKNRSDRLFVCAGSPCVRDHLDLGTITRKVFERRVKEVKSPFQSMFQAAAKTSNCFKK